MSDHTAVRSTIYVAGAVILAANHNNNENAIFTAYNGSMHATTGHTHTGTTGDAPKLNSTGLDMTANYTWTGTHVFGKTNLSIKDDSGSYTTTFVIPALSANYLILHPAQADLSSTSDYLVFANATQTITAKTFTNPTINAATISGTFAGAATFSGALSFTNDISIATTKGVYFGTGNDTGLLELTANELRVVANSVAIVDFVSGGLALQASQDIRIVSGRRIYLDGSFSGNTYITEGASDQIYLIAGGENCTITTTGVLLSENQDLRLDSTKKVRFDGSLAGDTYILQSSANVLDFHAGSTTAPSLRLNAGNNVAVLNGMHLSVQALSQIFLDSDSSGTVGDTSIRQSSANVMTFKTGGVDRFTIDNGGDILLRATNTYMYWDGFSNTQMSVRGTATGALQLRGYNGSSTYLLTVGGTGSSGASIVGDFYPGTNNTYKIGISGARWTEVFATNGTINTSDEREKTEIITSDLGLDFINSLAPVSFRWREGDKKKHYGLIAQQVKKVLEGKEFGGLYEGESMGLAYTDLIGPIIKAIQELHAMNEKIAKSH